MVLENILKLFRNIRGLSKWVNVLVVLAARVLTTEEAYKYEMKE